MIIPTHFQPPEAPHLFPIGLDGKSAEHAFLLRSTLQKIEKFARAISADIMLFQNSSIEHQKFMDLRDRSKNPALLYKNSLFKEWKVVAARDASMNVHHLVISINNLTLKNIPEWQNVVDHQILRSARKDLSKIFPFSKQLRNSVSHLGDLNSTTDKQNNNFAKIPEVDGISISNGPILAEQLLINNTFIMTIEGISVSIDLKEGTINLINGVVEKVFNAFRPIIKIYTNIHP